jgi:hypothetical protein
VLTLCEVSVADNICHEADHGHQAPPFLNPSADQEDQDFVPPQKSRTCCKGQDDGPAAESLAVAPVLDDQAEADSSQPGMSSAVRPFTPLRHIASYSSPRTASEMIRAVCATFIFPRSQSTRCESAQHNPGIPVLQAPFSPFALLMTSRPHFQCS